MKPIVQETDAEPPVVPVPLPKVTNNYHSYAPPFDVATAVEKMLASVPPKFLVGLSEVVLTNTAGMPRKQRRNVTKSRKRKVQIVRAAGLYHQTWNNQPAWIEIIVDNCLRGWKTGWWLKLKFIRDERIGNVLFHEIGHHIHFAVRPEYREREDVADVWKVRLSEGYSRRAYPLLKMIARVLKLILGPLFSFIIRKSTQKEFEKGMISRAEFEERTRKSHRK